MQGHEANPVLILTGAPGSGKTTVAQLLASRSQRAVHLEADRFFHFIPAGYIEPWKPEPHEQNTTVMRIVAETAASYATAGYFTIVDDRRAGCCWSEMPFNAPAAWINRPRRKPMAFTRPARSILDA